MIAVAATLETLSRIALEAIEDEYWEQREMPTDLGPDDLPEDVNCDWYACARHTSGLYR